MRAHTGVVGAYVAGVLVALVNHLQVGGREGLAQHGVDSGRGNVWGLHAWGCLKIDSC